MIGQAADEAHAPERRRQLVALDDLAGEAVLLERCRVVAHVLGLLLRHREPQQADLAQRVAGAELVGELVDLALGLERARVHRRARSAPKRSRASLWKAATPAIRKPPLRPLAPPATVPASIRTVSIPCCASRPRAREPAHAAADHADLGLDVALERGARLVRRVEPEGVVPALTRPLPAPRP